MKKIIKKTFLFGLLFLSGILSAQYKISEMIVMKPGVMSQGIAYDDTVDKVTRVLGKPTKIEDFYFEINEEYGKIYYYNKNKIFILNNKVSSIDLSDNTLAFGKKNKFQIRIGDEIQTKIYYRDRGSGMPKIKTVENYIGGFTDTDIKKEKGRSRNIDYTGYISSNNLVDDNNVRYEIGFGILFTNNKVISIFLGEP
ncbi:hypothetical protein O2K51_10555 [Apibacter raozihei]|uniref:hypothetical protein n=1 Tax=Apibacter raozihei TaxID=2500547 RepID=UPI000FE2A1E0|nr:hypothetical protein [Apibacter raozihei]